jgi:hypothetical protein
MIPWRPRSSREILPPAIESPRQPAGWGHRTGSKPGTVLVREYQGERHRVTVDPDGHVWREATYVSICIIAHDHRHGLEWPTLLWVRRSVCSTPKRKSEKTAIRDRRLKATDSGPKN